MELLVLGLSCAVGLVLLILALKLYAKKRREAQTVCPPPSPMTTAEINNLTTINNVTFSSSYLLTRSTKAVALSPIYEESRFSGKSRASSVWLDDPGLSLPHSPVY
ncbi:hypothetical protein GN958_ATG17764 [Phytophthora infestans]|uniref:Uncharacterized protein n=1 Tax=Phytophthora infestans TaxID=4787 RepID=A0A8S9U456_PHYIN|nr:hypothetical protein GN958_ATG17764 [Phytophthora infestans]